MADQGFRAAGPIDNSHSFQAAPQGIAPAALVRTANVRQAPTPNKMPQHIMEPVAYRSGLPGGLPTPAQARGDVPVGPQSAPGYGGYDPRAAAPAAANQAQQAYRQAGPVATDPLTEILDSIGGGLKGFLESIFGAGNDDAIGGQQGQQQGGSPDIVPYVVDPRRTLDANSLAAPVKNATVKPAAAPQIDPALSAAPGKMASAAPTDGPPLSNVFANAIDPFGAQPMGQQQAFAQDDPSALLSAPGDASSGRPFGGEGFASFG